MKKPIVLLDVDGVLADFVGASCSLIKQLFGIDASPEKVTRWEIEECFGLTESQKSILFGAWQWPNFCRALSPIPGARDAVDRLREVAEVHFLTTPMHGAFRWMHDRTEWLATHFAATPHEVTHTSKKHLVYGHVFVDDKPTNVFDWQKAHPNGAAFLWSGPHNVSGPQIAYRTNNWQAVVNAAALARGLP